MRRTSVLRTSRAGSILYLLVTSWCFVSSPLAGQAPIRLTNFNDQGWSEPGYCADLNGVALFSADDGLNGRELWRSDGTASGTVLVADIVPGEEGSWPAHLFVHGGVVYFSARDALRGRELWRSDGTEAGTVFVKDINPGPGDASFVPTALVIGDTFYFRVDDGTHGMELWKSDGTEAGTVLVKDIHPAGDSMPAYEDTHFANVNGVLFFFANDGVHGRELWTSDGTEAGTSMVKDIRPGTLSSLTSHQGGTVLGDTFLFLASDGVSGTELWKSDGSESGTVLVKDINPGPPGIEPDVDWLTVRFRMQELNGHVLFPARDEVHGVEMWISDGTESGTTLLRDINPGPKDSIRQGIGSFGASYRLSIVVAQGNAYFPASDGIHGWELWKTDGTDTGTTLIKDINPGPDSSNWFHNYENGPEMAWVNDTLFLAAYDGVSYELWRSDGSEAGTALVKALTNCRPIIEVIDEEVPSSCFGALYGVGAALFFTAITPEAPRELYKSDGTEAGTGLVKDIHLQPVQRDSHWPFNLTNGGDGKLYFTGSDYQGTTSLCKMQDLYLVYDHFANPEPWVSDGTEGGTTTLEEIRSSPHDGSQPREFTVSNGRVFFTVRKPTSLYSHPDLELWTTGTTGVAERVADISAFELTDVDATLFFSGHDGMTDGDLWKSDGTPEGTVVVKDTARPPENLRADGIGGLFFTITIPGGDDELWWSDGSDAGTLRVTPVDPPPGSFPGYVSDGNGALYFSSQNDSGGNDLWISDRTEEGTFIIAPGVRIGTGTLLDGVLYFSGDESGVGTELWRSDGTEAGTFLLRDIRSGPEGSSPRELVGVNGVLYFTADDGVHGRELWRSDGTWAGTSLVKDVHPDSSGNHAPRSLTPSGCFLYFGADDGAHGYELWRSDGTTTGTVLVEDLLPGELGSLISPCGFEESSVEPVQLEAVGDSLFFAADDGETGRELWKYSPLCETVCPLTCRSNGVDIELTWTNPEPFDAITITRNSEIIFTTFDGMTSSFVDADPPPGTYTYQIQGGCGEGVWSLPLGCEVTHPPPPNCLPVSRVQCETSADDVLLTWENESGYVWIVVYREGEEIAVLPGQAISFADSSLLPGQYTYEVQGVCREASRSQLCVVDLQCLPLTVSELACSPRPDLGGVRLTWTNAASYDSITILRSGLEIASLTGGETSFLDPGEAPEEIEYSVVAHCAGEASAPATCEVPPFIVDCPPVDDLECQDLGFQQVRLAWTNPYPYETIRVYSDSELIWTGSGAVESYTNYYFVAPGEHLYEVEAVCPFGATAPTVSCRVFVAPDFIRGDVDGDGVFNGLVDTLYLLRFQFQNGPVPPCTEAADADGDSTLNGLVDGLFVLGYQFQGGFPMPPPPFPSCDGDPDASATLGCRSHPGCED